MIAIVTVLYRDMNLSLEVDLTEYNNEDQYLEIIKDHVNIAKKVIDKRHEKSVSLVLAECMSKKQKGLIDDRLNNDKERFV